MIRYVAREYFAKTKTSLPFDEAAFQETVRSHWNYSAPCEQTFWTSHLRQDGAWQCEIAPVFQEVFGGEDDGKRVWAGFDIDLNGFSKEPGVEFQGFAAMSMGVRHHAAPFVRIMGEYFGQRFILWIHQEPIVDSEVREIVDVLRNEVRAFLDEEEL